MRVICTLPNASNLINGVAFEAHKLGMISEEVEQDVADTFLAIAGYVLDDEVKAKPVTTTVAPTETPIVVDAGAAADPKKPTAQGKK